MERPTVKPQRLVDAETREDSWVGRQIAGRYRIIEPLGEGGMGTIFLAEHLTLGRRVALKVLLEELAHKESIRKRFDREAKTLSGLHHPNIVAVSDYGVDGGTPFLVMELAPGDDLAKALETSRPTPAQAFQVFRQLLRGVAHAHSAGLVHRDLKPSNVMVRFLGDGSIHVQVLDFGLARFEDDASQGGPKLTRAGAILGTPAYMAPEQASGEGAVAASDTYAAGLILYEMLAGRRPFADQDPTRLLRAHLMEPPPPLSETAAHLNVPPAVEAFITKALAKERGARFATAGEMLQAFEQLPVPTERRANPTSGLNVGPGLTLASGKHAAQSLMEAGKKVPTLVWIAGTGGLAVVAILVFLLVDWNGPEAPTTPPIGQPMGPTAMQGTPTMEASAMRSPTEMGSSTTMGSSTEMGAPPPSEYGWGDLPEPLASAQSRLASRDRRLPRRMEANLLQYARRNPEDPRPHLLLGRSYGNDRALTDAVGEYREAWELDHAMRHDAKMKDHLVEASMANTGRLRAGARNLITSAYGRSEIQAVIETRMESVNRDERRRLQQVLNALR